MGLGSSGDDLHVGMFGKTAVDTVPLAGGAATPFLTGFKGGVIGVGVDGTNLHAGDATGLPVAVPLA